MQMLQKVHHEWIANHKNRLSFESIFTVINSTADSESGIRSAEITNAASFSTRAQRIMKNNHRPRAASAFLCPVFRQLALFAAHALRRGRT